MAENTLAILRYLSSDASPLPSLTTGYTRPTTVFFAEFGSFVQYQFSTARVMYGTLFSLSLAMVWFVYRESVPGSQSAGFWTAQWNGARALLVAFCGALIGANGLAAIMHRILNHNMSWFASEHSALLLYGPAALAGVLFTLYAEPILDVLARHARVTGYHARRCRAQRTHCSSVDAVRQRASTTTTRYRFSVLHVRLRGAIVRCFVAGRASESWCRGQSVGVRAGLACTPSYRYKTGVHHPGRVRSPSVSSPSCPNLAYNLIHLSDWTARCRCACGTYHRIYRHSCIISRRTARYAILAPFFSTCTEEFSHNTEHHYHRYCSGIRCPFTFR